MVNRYFKTVIIFGALLAIINILLAQTFRYLNISPFSAINNILFAPVLITLYMAIKLYSKHLNHTLSFKSAISISLVTNLTSSLIIAIFTYIYFSINQNELNYIEQESYKQYIQQNSHLGKSADLLKKDFQENVNIKNNSPFTLALSNFTMGVFLSMVLSIIVSIFYRIINKKK